jgi:hypothetical protein
VSRVQRVHCERQENRLLECACLKGEALRREAYYCWVIRPVNNGDGFNWTSVYPINTGFESGNYVFIFLRLSGNFFFLWI